MKYCQQVLHHQPVLHGRLQVNWSAKVGILVSYFPRKWAALPQQDKPAPLYSNFVSCQHFCSICKPGNGNPLILSTRLALNSCKDVYFSRCLVKPPGTPFDTTSTIKLMQFLLIPVCFTNKSVISATECLMRNVNFWVEPSHEEIQLWCPDQACGLSGPVLSILDC